MQLVITATGTVRCVYDETIALSSLGHVEITRGSHVEPDAAGHWQADLSPVGGPMLGPFLHRSAALAAEHDWLETHWLMSPPSPVVTSLISRFEPNQHQLRRLSPPEVRAVCLSCHRPNNTGASL